MIHLDCQQFHERIGSLLNKFKPNTEVFEEIRQKEKLQIDPSQCKDIDLIILKEQELGTVISVEGSGLRKYLLRINKGTFDIWQNPKANGLRGPLECIISFLETGKHESFDLEEGVMKKTYGFSLPLFLYNGTKPLERSAIKPQGPLLDKYEHIYVWKKA